MTDGAFIRPPTPSDAPALADILHAAGFREHYGDALGDPEDVIARALETGLVSVAAVGDEVAGFVWLGSNTTFGYSGYVRLIAVSPQWRGRGVGQALMKHAEEIIFAQSQHAFLLTSDFNSGAQRFYQRLGWKKVGELPGFACAEVTEFIYWKPRSR